MTKGLMANTVHESQQAWMTSILSFPLSASIIQYVLKTFSEHIIFGRLLLTRQKKQRLGIVFSFLWRRHTASLITQEVKRKKINPSNPQKSGATTCFSLCGSSAQ